MTAQPSRRSARPQVSSRAAPWRWFSATGVFVFTVAIGLLAAQPPPAAATVEPTESVRMGDATHPIDRQLEQATEGLGPSSATAVIYAEFEAKWDAELNRGYRLLLAELSPGEQTLLREAQRAWLKSRDSDTRLVEALYCPAGRSIPTMTVSAHAYAQMNLTRERALLLLRWRERHAEIAAELGGRPE